MTFSEKMFSFKSRAYYFSMLCGLPSMLGGGPRVLVGTAEFQARVRGSVPDLGGLKEAKNVSSPSTCESQ